VDLRGPHKRLKVMEKVSGNPLLQASLQGVLNIKPWNCLILKWRQKGPENQILSILNQEFMLNFVTNAK